MFLYGTLKQRYGSKTVLLLIYGHVVTLIFDLQIFKNAWHCTNKSFPWIKVAAWYIKVELWPHNWIFANIWSSCKLGLWSLDLEGFRLTCAYTNPPPRNLSPFQCLKNMNLEGEKSVYLVKNIGRMGKTIYEFKVNLFPSKKQRFLSNFRWGGWGEVAWGQVCMCMS